MNITDINTFRAALGTLSMVLSVVSFLPYMYDVVRRKTRPHAFSWFIWGGLSSINFTLSLGQHGGAGAWVWGLIAGESLAVFLLGLAFGEYRPSSIDYVCLAGATVALGVWWVSNQPVLAAALIALVQLLGFVPTFRKAYRQPHSETLSIYSLGTLLLLLSIGALQQYTAATLLYPLACASLNAAMALFLWLRRHRVAPPRRHFSRLVPSLLRG